MEIKQNLNIPASYFYQKVIDSVLFDIRKQTGEKITEAQLANYTYEKKFSSGVTARLKVTQLIKDQSYHYQTVSNRGTSNVSYDIFASGPNAIQVIYREKSTTTGKLQQVNDMLVGIVLGFFRKRGFKKMLKQIEQSYQAN